MQSSDCPHPELDALPLAQQQASLRDEPTASMINDVAIYWVQQVRHPVAKDRAALVSDVHQRLLAALPHYQGLCPLRLYIRMQVRYACADAREKAEIRRTHEMPLEDEDTFDGRLANEDITDPAQMLAKGCDSAWFLARFPVLRLVLRLLNDDEHRALSLRLFLLRHFDGMEPKELAARYGMDAETISHRIEGWQRLLQAELRRRFPHATNHAIIEHLADEHLTEDAALRPDRREEDIHDEHS